MNTIKRAKSVINGIIDGYRTAIRGNTNRVDLADSFAQELSGNYWTSTQVNGISPHTNQTETGVYYYDQNNDIHIDRFYKTSTRKIRCAFSYGYYVPDNLERKYGLSDAARCVKDLYNQCRSCLESSGVGNCDMNDVSMPTFRFASSKATTH